MPSLVPIRDRTYKVTGSQTAPRWRRGSKCGGTWSSVHTIMIYKCEASTMMYWASLRPSSQWLTKHTKLRIEITPLGDFRAIRCSSPMPTGAQGERLWQSNYFDAQCFEPSATSQLTFQTQNSSGDPLYSQALAQWLLKWVLVTWRYWMYPVPPWVNNFANYSGGFTCVQAPWLWFHS